MKKYLGLLILTGVCALAACSPPSVPAAQVQQLTDLAPVIVKATPSTDTGNPVSGNPPVTFGGPLWIEVTAIRAGRSPGSGANCTGVASEGEQHRLYIRSANCGAVGAVGLTFTLDGQTTPEVLGDQDLILVQKRAGIAERVSAVVKVNGEVIWPK